jgi:hypothetical protein
VSSTRAASAHVLLALDRVACRRVDFEIDELTDVKSFRVAFDEAIAMLIDASDEIAGDADIDRAAGPACENVQIILSHDRELA